MQYDLGLARVIESNKKDISAFSEVLNNKDNSKYIHLFPSTDGLKSGKILWPHQRRIPYNFAVSKR